MRIALLGDIALFGKMSVNENPNVAAYFSEIAEYLKGFDYVVGNLETPFSVKKKTNGAKSVYICSDVENVQTLKQLHINAVCLANNHMFDYGKEGYETTKRILNENGINYFGTEGKEVYAEILGNKLAFSGFCCYTSNPLRCVKYGEYGVNAYNIPVVKEVLRKNDSQGFLNIAAVHAGIEHVNYPSIEHVRAARLLAEICPYVYYGHHPHVFQGVEALNKSVIAHSLGNFCFDDVYSDMSDKPLVKLTENNRTGIILELKIEDSKVHGWREQLIYISQEGKLKLTENEDVIAKYNDCLVHCEEDLSAYEFRRNHVIISRIAERRAKRTLSWYIKRLRPRYLQIIINAKKNKRLYQQNVVKYI